MASAPSPAAKQLPSHDPPATPTSPEDNLLLTRANNRITYLTKENHRLAAKLKDSELMLSRCMDLAHKQFRKISSLSATLHDTIYWDPSGCPRPSDLTTCGSPPSPPATAHAHLPDAEWIRVGAKPKIPPIHCSTPNQPASSRLWTDVVRGAKTKSSAPGSKSCLELELSNRFGPLSVTAPAVTAAAVTPPEASSDRSAVRSAARSAVAHPATAPAETAVLPSAVSADRAAVQSSVGQRTKSLSLPRPSTSSTSVSSRRRIVKEAARRAIHSGGSCRPRPSDAADTPQTPPRALASHLPAAVHPVRVDRAANANFSPQLSSSPRPLFSPTTLIVGDSIIRNVRFFNATTHCLPGATVPVILNKLPELLHSSPSSITRVLVHVGCVDSSRQQSELIKNDFLALFRFLKDTGKGVFFSGPLPIHTHGAGRFSRLLSLNTWLQSTCRAFNFAFIDNFNLFWNRPSFYRADGVHPSSLGSRTLTANIQHAVQNAPRD